MTIQKFIEKAIEGGWKEKITHFQWTRGNTETKIYNKTVFLDPLAWKAVGKVQGWKEKQENNFKASVWNYMPEWRENMHRMIEALTSGKTITEFIETL